MLEDELEVLILDELLSSSDSTTFGNPAVTKNDAPAVADCPLSFATGSPAVITNIALAMSCVPVQIYLS